MDIAGIRTLTSQLSDDLSWLEQYCGTQRDINTQAHSNHLRLAAALVRNTIGPFLDNQPPTPLHVTVVGGAGAGKSTVVNLLVGAVVTVANPQAGYTRHPIAFTNANGAVSWPAHVGFLGPLQRLQQEAEANLDKDVYQVRRVSLDAHSATLLKDFVVWDCPDMTTWAASGYVPRLLEICGLADVLVYVASDERYNDEVPTQFLKLLLGAGKPVVCCLTKLKEADAQAFLKHFNEAVLSQLAGGAVNCLAIPWMAKEELMNPTGRAAKYRIQLLNQVAALGQPPMTARRRSVRYGMNYLLSATDQLLSVARNDLNALENWRATVQNGRQEFDNRYRLEYLNTEKFRRFDEALVRLMELLELPGVGQVVSNTLYVLRTPYRLFKSWLSTKVTRPEGIKQAELPVLEAALNGWLDQLRKEAVRQAAAHPVWAHIEKGFESGTLAEQAKEKFQQGYRSFQLGLADEIERTARAIYEDLEKNPVALTALRGGKFAIDVAAIAATLVVGHIGVQDIILVPLAASMTHQLVEWFGAAYVDNQREQTRNRQMALVDQYISTPLAEWLTQWPATGGSNYERLQEALKRVPPGVQQLDQAVTQKLGSTL
jgi:hypothetical protein